MFEGCLRWLAWPLLLVQGAPHVPPSLHLADFPVRLQSTNYSCGPASLSGVLAYYGIHETEKDVMEACGTRAEVGTNLRTLAQVATAKGLANRVKTHLELMDIAESLASGAPLLALIQDGPLNSKEPIDYSTVWDQGHYVVITGLDAERVYFMDPFGKRGIRDLPLSEFMARWHDLSFTGEKFERAGLVFPARSSERGFRKNP